MTVEFSLATLGNSTAPHSQITQPDFSSLNSSIRIVSNPPKQITAHHTDPDWLYLMFKGWLKGAKKIYSIEITVVTCSQSLASRCSLNIHVCTLKLGRQNC